MNLPVRCQVVDGDVYVHVVDLAAAITTLKNDLGDDDKYAGQRAALNATLDLLQIYEREATK